MPTTQTNHHQSSGGPAEALAFSVTETGLDFTTLDRTVDRYGLLQLAKRVGKEGGFTPRMLQLLEYYLAYTTAADWEEGSRPIVFQSLARTAMDLGVGERQVQKLEKRLFDVGAIAWNDSGNHKRFGRRDPRTGRLVFAYGVDLTPLAYLQEELEAKLDQKRLYAAAWRQTKRIISQQRRQIRASLQQWREEGAGPRMLDPFELAYREIAIELRSHLDLARLRDLAQSHRKLLSEIDEAMQPHPQDPVTPSNTPLPIAPVTRGRTRSHAQKFAHQQHKTLVKKREADARDREDDGIHSDDTKAIGKITPQQFVQYAGDRLRERLPLTTQPLHWDDVVEAADQTRRDLGVSQQAWGEACGSLGRVGAVACLVLTDRAATRGVQPIRYPSAYFRRLSQRGAEGRLEWPLRPTGGPPSRNAPTLGRPF
jgi:hypothetical protein